MTRFVELRDTERAWWSATDSKTSGWTTILRGHHVSFGLPLANDLPKPGKVMNKNVLTVVPANAVSLSMASENDFHLYLKMY